MNWPLIGAGSSVFSCQAQWPPPLMLDIMFRKGASEMARVRVYPHNDLLNLAHYQRETINNKVAEGIKEAISLDCLSCIVSMAFAVEALVNFVGHQRVQDWRERRPYRRKIEEVCSVAGLAFDEAAEPFLTIWQLKETRDMIAHGQPYEGNQNVRTREELHAAMECPWDQYLTPEYINHAYEQVKEFEHRLLDGAGISIANTLTSFVWAGFET